jgi:hypothetical protein
MPLVFHIHLSSQGKVLVQDFDKHPIIPDNEAGVELLQAIPKSVPRRLQPSQLGLKVKQNTLRACQHFPGEEELLSSTFNTHFEQWTRKVDDADTKEKGMFDWMRDIGRRRAQSTLSITVVPHVYQPALRVAGTRPCSRTAFYVGQVLLLGVPKTKRLAFGKVEEVLKASVKVHWFKWRTRSRWSKHLETVRLSQVIPSRKMSDSQKRKLRICKAVT